MSVFQTYRIDWHVEPRTSNGFTRCMHDALSARPVPVIPSNDAAYCEDYADEAHVDEVLGAADWAAALTRNHNQLDAAG